jgi:Flp pilus assembly protein TadD
MDLYVPVTYTFWSGLAAVADTGAADPAGISLNPLLFHAANLLLHLASTLIVWQILSRLTRRAAPATIGALFFGLHPVQVETVGWISGAKDLLAGLFSLLSIWQYLLHTESTDRTRRLAHLLAAFTAFLLAMLSKPAAIMTPIAIAAIDLWILKRPWRQTLRTLWFWGLAAVPVMVVAKLVQPTPETYAAPLWTRPLLAADALAAYAGKLLWPSRLAIDYGRSPEWLLSSTQRYWTWLVPTAIAAACIISRRRLPWLIASATITAAFLAPVLGLVKFDFQRYSTVADHYLYTAMVGVAIAVAFALSQTNRRWPYAAAGIVLLAFAIRTTAQALSWRDSHSLFSHAVAVNPTSLAGHNGLGEMALDANRPTDAIRHFSLARDAHPADAIINFNLGNAFLVANRPRDAVAPYRVAIDGGKRYPFMYVNLAGALARAGDLTPSTAVAEEGLDHFPDNAELRYTLATLLAARGAWHDAAGEYEAALRLNPSLTPARDGLAEARRRTATRPATRP